jgi:hypothetical protein
MRVKTAFGKGCRGFSTGTLFFLSNLRARFDLLAGDLMVILQKGG